MREIEDYDMSVVADFDSLQMSARKDAVPSGAIEPKTGTAPGIVI